MPSPSFLRHRRAIVHALAAVVPVLVASSGCSSPRAAPAAPATRSSAVMVRDVDGDTIIIRLGGRTEDVRLLGIDTPETKDPRKPVQCYGHEASAHTSTLLPPGTALLVARDAEPRDRYGRLLLYVWRAHDHLFVNRDLAVEGFASLLTFAPNTTHEGELSAAVDQARGAGRGLWGRCGGPGVPLASMPTTTAADPP